MTLDVTIKYPMNNIFRVCIILVAVLLVGGCSSGKDIPAAKAEIARFRELMATQQFDQIYSEASDDLKKAATQQDFVNLLTAVNGKLGAVKGAEDNGWRVDFKRQG